MNFTKEELDNEIWKDVLRYDYEYQISNLGRFKRVTSFHKNNKGEITVGSLDSRGYLRTNLTKEGKNISKKFNNLSFIFLFFKIKFYIIRFCFFFKKIIKNKI